VAKGASASAAGGVTFVLRVQRYVFYLDLATFLQKIFTLDEKKCIFFRRLPRKLYLCTRK
jgi:hypothetical protein